MLSEVGAAARVAFVSSTFSFWSTWRAVPDTYSCSDEKQELRSRLDFSILRIDAFHANFSISIDPPKFLFFLQTSGRVASSFCLVSYGGISRCPVKEAP